MLQIPKIFLDNFAHEVYVLDAHTIDRDEHNHHVNIWHALNSTHNWVLFSSFAVLIAALFAYALYLRFQPVFQNIGKRIDKTTTIAPDVIRLAFGASLLFSASHDALFGPELPLHGLFADKLIKVCLWVCGTGLIVGLWSRVWSWIVIAIWTLALLLKGPYLLTYSNYLGEAIAVILLPIQKMSVDGQMIGKAKAAKLMKHAWLSMPIARLLFALSLAYTAISVKFMDTSLTLDVVNHYHLTRFFPFDPLFVVLGAALIEVTVALLYLSGILLRFTSVIFLVVMSLSLMFFKESVWPHYLLIALGIGLFLHKPDDWSVDAYLGKSKKLAKLFRKTK
ncbi:MAG TPA: hypothetical protein VLF59_02430 [Candidatus Saccharimonadales bacterium]|nr:hypothetical protein [Candidatus Saccharimonadales bacterium]